jgi:hypothetical protein
MALQNVLAVVSDELEKTVESAKKQVVPKEQKSTDNSGNTGSEYFKQMMKDLTKLDPGKLEAKKQQDANAAQAQKAQIRSHLNHYQEQENALKAYRAKKAQELRADIAGKPGQGKNMQEQAEKMEDMQKKQKEQEKKKQGLPDSIEQLKGTKEIGKFAVG